jgi:hypothetical protein
LSYATLAHDLKTVWTAPETDARLKKRITELRLPRRRRGQRNSTSPDIVAAVRQLALIAKDDVIAGILNRNGLRTGNGNRWTRERVTALRSSYKIPVHRRAEDGCEPWLNLGQAAALVGVAPRTLRISAEKDEIEAMHPLSDGPWIFKREELTGDAAQTIVRRAQRSPKHPAVPDPAQQSLFSSTT